ncbi:pyruvate dehydrogenase (acetyl-transferring) E1 component subunit alpha [Alkalihalobacillus sp. LMS39]|uniref:pyruvate dehydrogenase (acetyl-transferring) E1 component subunit alpha n=1 Tax=Alkalihalobacillus sp. LMS39 TaxID=2924032 RepID=UPI001FB24821|nr:pyruvate dehydrogenase (acetyl-transferring) E1 component subunit alpha [Alkalihalobacillus sp. LMS39]UOE94900.1 pyruvate dehydrogenase (acetyl-transferring) E1 component subunit alpha [Alkalihalobacillus sp. LMS39]
MAMKSSELPFANYEFDLFQVLTPEGDLTNSISGKIDEALMVNMYENMVMVRAFDRKSINLQRQGRMGTYAPFEGQEASQVGSALALSSNDWLFPTYRDHAAALVFGQEMYRVFLYWMGHMDGSTCTDGKRIMPPSVPIATQMLHAVGTAWASKLDKEKNVSLAFFGDGATSEGDFHEALNFAGVLKTPTVFLCQNNGYAISVPFSSQSASRTIAQRAIAYDIKGVRVDGNDIFAVFLAVKEAIKRAENGEGPTLIEAMTFRYGAHTTADDPKKYRDQEKLAKEWRDARDPLARLQKYLVKKGLWSESKEEQLWTEMNMRIDEELKKAEMYPKADPMQMFDHVYATTPWHIEEQKQEFKQGQKGRN